MQPYACERCDGIEWDSEPKWRDATDVERERHGWMVVPVFNPERSTCKGCGIVMVWTAREAP